MLQWQLQQWRGGIQCHYHWCGLQVWHLPMTTVTMAGTGVEGWHLVSLSLVRFTGVAFTCGCTVAMAATALEM